MTEVVYKSLAEMMKDGAYYLLYYVTSDLLQTNQNNLSQYKLKVVFLQVGKSALNDYKNLKNLQRIISANNLTQNSLHYYADSADLHDFVPFTIWYRGKRIANVTVPNYHGDYYFGNDIKFSSFKHKNYYLDAATNQLFYQLENDKIILKIPFMELLRFFYLSDSYWNKLVFNGEIDIPKIINVNYSSFQDGECVLRLKNEVFLDSVGKASLLYTSPNYLVNIKLIHQYFTVKQLNLDNLPLQIPLVDLPFNFSDDEERFNLFQLTYLGNYSKISNPKLTKIIHTVYRIQSLDFSFPYENIFWFRNITPTTNTVIDETSRGAKDVNVIKSLKDEQPLILDDIPPDEIKPTTIFSGTIGFPHPVKDETLQIKYKQRVKQIIENCSLQDNNGSTVGGAAGGDLEPIVTGHDNFIDDTSRNDEFYIMRDTLIARLQDEYTTDQVKILPISQFNCKKGLKKHLRFKNRTVCMLEVLFDSRYCYVMDISCNQKNKESPLPLFVFCDSKSKTNQISLKQISIVLNLLMELKSGQKVFNKVFGKNNWKGLQHRAGLGQSLELVMAEKAIVTINIFLK